MVTDDEMYLLTTDDLIKQVRCYNIPPNLTKKSSWVYKDNDSGGGLLVGDYPEIISSEREHHMDILLDNGVKVFINLCDDSQSLRSYRRYVMASTGIMPIII